MFKKKKISEALIVKRKALQMHKVEIKKLNKQIKKHKMLIKQAKLQYKITNS